LVYIINNYVIFILTNQIMPTGSIISIFLTLLLIIFADILLLL